MVVQINEAGRKGPRIGKVSNAKRKGSRARENKYKKRRAFALRLYISGYIRILLFNRIGFLLIVIVLVDQVCDRRYQKEQKQDPPECHAVFHRLCTCKIIVLQICSFCCTRKKIVFHGHRCLSCRSNCFPFGCTCVRNYALAACSGSESEHAVARFTGKEVCDECCRHGIDDAAGESEHRTAGEDAASASGVLPDGRVSMTGWDVDYTVLGVRPMIRVAPDAVADGRVAEPDDNLPFHIISSSNTFHYKQRNVKLEADTDVTWSSSNENIASINAETGEVTINRVGTVTITATSKETGEKVEFQMEIDYLWWQQMIRIFLFGWIWY